MEECENDLEGGGIEISNATNRLKNKEEMSSWELLARMELDAGLYLILRRQRYCGGWKRIWRKEDGEVSKNIIDSDEAVAYKFVDYICY